MLSALMESLKKMLQNTVEQNRVSCWSRIHGATNAPSKVVVSNCLEWEESNRGNGEKPRLRFAEITLKNILAGQDTLTLKPTWWIFFFVSVHLHVWKLHVLRWWAGAGAYAIVAAPAGDGVSCVSHLLQGLGAQVAQLPQAAVVEHPGADPAGVQVVSRPHLAHVAHLVARRLG